MTITVTLTATATDEWLAAAEAPDCESAVLAARTLWHDAQQAERELRRSSSAYRPCNIRFSNADTGQTLHFTKERPS